MLSPLKKDLAVLLSQAISKATGVQLSESELEAAFEVPRDTKFGDLSTNVAMRLAKEKKTAPRGLAEEIKKAVDVLIEQSPLKKRIAKSAVEGAGFINFYHTGWEVASVVLDIQEHKDTFGKPKDVKPKKILLEFVSANPTGPLTVAHGRQAALGDSLYRILSFCGHKVSREYYNNDEGVQIRILGQSIRARLLEEIGKADAASFLENGYKGEYIRDLAKQVLKSDGKAAADKPEEFFSRFGKETILESIKKDLQDFGVEFDNYYSQEALMKSGHVEKALEVLRQKGFVYEKDGAVWFESTRFGDDKDRVLIKSDKSYTYLMPDIAYHEDKFKRGFDFLINILGPDHHGYIPRIKAAADALGFSSKALEILIAQLVTLFEGEKTLRMSTRAGEFVTLREILDEVGKDAGRFFFLMRKFDAHLDFDLALAKTQTPENPVFYIQYAHARIESIKTLFREKNCKLSWNDTDCLALLTSVSEVGLMRQLSLYEAAVASAERTLEPFRLVPYLQELAGLFHRFYTDHRVVTEDPALTQARMMLTLSTQSVIRSGLSLLGVSAPLKM